MEDSNKKRALFIDRDGVMIHLVKYEYGWNSAQKPKDVRLVDGVEKVIAWANKRDLPMIEISNQPGVAKGKMSREKSAAIEARVHELLLQRGAKIGKAYIYLHHPNGMVPELTRECECRKPKPGLLLQAKRELGIDLNESVFLGDKASDVQAGKAAGCKTIILLHNEDSPEKVEQAEKVAADYRVRSLKQVIPILEELFA